MQATDQNAQVQQQPATDDTFVTDNAAAESPGDDDEEEGEKSDKKAGRRKIKIEFIQDKSRRHITFSKRKADECRFWTWLCFRHAGRVCSTLAGVGLAVHFVSIIFALFLLV